MFSVQYKRLAKARVDEGKSDAAKKTIRAKRKKDSKQKGVHLKEGSYLKNKRDSAEEGKRKSKKKFEQRKEERKDIASQKEKGRQKYYGDKSRELTEAQKQTGWGQHQKDPSKTSSESQRKGIKAATGKDVNVEPEKRTSINRESQANKQGKPPISDMSNFPKSKGSMDKCGEMSVTKSESGMFSVEYKRLAKEETRPLFSGSGAQQAKGFGSILGTPPTPPPQPVSKDEMEKCGEMKKEEDKKKKKELKGADHEAKEIEGIDFDDEKKNSPKSEMEKCGEMKKAKVDEGKTIAQKQSARFKRKVDEFDSPKGVNVKNSGGKRSPQEGTSEAGDAVREAKRGKPENKKLNIERAKRKHKEVISEQKKMKKPSLPKSEDVYKSEKLASFLKKKS
jgi:hypothetical protein